MTSLNDLTSNSELGSNGRYLVKSKKKEDALNASTQVWEGGLIIVVEYSGIKYVKITDGTGTFTTLKKIGEGGDSEPVTWTTLTGKPTVIAAGTTATDAKTVIGLQNVSNTSDANKPVSTAQQTALNLKANIASPTFTGVVTSPSFVGALTGNSSSATALATGRTFSLTGGATGTSAAFTGAANATIAVSLAVPTNVVRGGVLMQPDIPDLGAAPSMSDFNNLLDALRNAGVLVTP